jgi:hypothetical protein
MLSAVLADSQPKEFEPKNSAFMQQTLKAWRPFLTFVDTAVVYLVFTLTLR